MTKLAAYKNKRNFKDTSEPDTGLEKTGEFKFVIQKHQASHLHYDFRLQLDGVLKSWAVPKGPPQIAGEKRLAVKVEDHPVGYINFKGIIPKGNYGAGKVEIFDTGLYIPVNEKGEAIIEKQALKNLKAGELKVILKGKKIKGSYVLVQIKNDDKNWLLIKHREKHIKQTPDNKNTGQNTGPVKSIQIKKNSRVEQPLKPMLAQTAISSFDDPGWIYEIKWDGYRAIAEKNNVLKLYSRNALNFGDRFPTIVNALEKIKHSFIIDGEIVWLNENGTANFQQLQNFDASVPGKLVYHVFDLIELNAENTKELNLLQRKELLKQLLGSNKTIRYNQHITGNGTVFFNECKKIGLEGIMAKRTVSTYHPGTRSSSWLKIKNIQTEEVTILGYTAPKGSRKKFGALITGKKKNNQWIFCGHVGTGFNEATLTQIYEWLQPHITPNNPFKKKIPVNDRPTWVKPVLVIEISFTEITKEGIYRHPVFTRLREDKMKTVLKKEIPAQEKLERLKQKASVKKGTQNIPLTNTEKIFWPQENYTKGDVIRYYQTMASYILPHLKDRPLSLKRNPNGIKDGGFYHKDAGANAPDFVKVFPYKNEGKTIDYIICNNEATLIYLANLGCIEMNPWNNRYRNPDNPDWLAIDIDPGDSNTFKQVIEVAQAAKEILDKAALKAFCKTSGATGIHIYIPLNAQYNYEIVKQFGAFFMQQIQEALPQLTTLERSKAKRGKKIYLDYLQNRKGQTLASAYSIRPVPGATVSAPIHWHELNSGLHPSQFTIKNIADRVKKNGDLFKEVLTQKNNLKKALQLLSK